MLAHWGMAAVLLLAACGGGSKQTKTKTTAKPIAGPPKPCNGDACRQACTGGDDHACYRLAYFTQSIELADFTAAATATLDPLCKQGRKAACGALIALMCPS